MSECCHGSAVALDVATELCLPKLNVTLGLARIALGAAVPKAAVDEDGDLAAGEGDVGLAGSLPFQAITRKARCAQALSYEQLGLGVGALVALHGLFDGGATADEFALVGGKVRGIDAVEQTWFGAFFATALRCALGFGGGFVGCVGRGVISGACLKPVFLQLNQGINEPLVGGHPLNGGKRGARNPADIELAVVLLGLIGFIGERAVVALHGEMEIGVVVLNGVEVTQVGDLHLQLFHELAAHGVFGCLAAHELAAREFPKSLHVAVAALHGKQLIGSFFANDPSGNMNSLQQESSLNIITWQASYPYLTQR